MSEQPATWSLRADWTEPLRRRPLATAFGCALAAAALGVRTGARPELAAVLYLAVAGTLLAVVDAALRRLPDPLTLPSYPVAAALLGVAAAVDGDAARFGGALAGMAALGALYAVQWVAVPDHIGLGDVKLAGVLGLYLGWYGTAAWVAGLLIAVLSGGAAAAALLLARRAGRRDALPYGPFLIGGTFAAVLLYAGS
ncbi:prepilin peptidase [Actinomadura atramentaria]|uniref:prepilin peptidase n=1 Tax=Actinomadura atramentaria TaxID=1990 RepID=UPI00036BE144|nr:prepilin peptidase [Actinomadura atramentaria]